MDVRQMALLGCGAAVVMLLVGCEVPQAAELVSASRAPRAASVAEALEEEIPEGALNPAAAMLDLEREGLRVLWQHDLSQVAQGARIRTIYLVGETLIAEAGGSLFHFDAPTGVWKATTSLKNSLSQPPVMVEGKLYLLTGKGLHKIDPATGLMLKRLSPKVGATCPPVAYPASILLGCGDGKVFRFGLISEQHVWLATTEGAVHTQPVVDGGNVYAAGYKGQVVAMSGDGGVVFWKWRPSAPAKIVSGLCLAGDRLYVGDNRGYVYCLTTSDGLPLWSYPAGAPISVTPQVARGKLLVFPYQSEALCLALGSRPTLMWRHPDAERLIATGEEGVYLLTRDHSVAYVLLETGREKWRRPLPKHCAVVSDPSEPTFCLYTASGAIMALQELP